MNRRVDYTRPDVEPYWLAEGDVVEDIRKSIDEHGEES